MIEQYESYQGPMPHPEHLERYEALRPGAAAMIFTEFQEQSRHRRDMERRIVIGNERRAVVGQIMAFILALVFLSAAVWLVLTGHETAGIAIGTTVLVALVTVFITGRRPKKG